MPARPERARQEQPIYAMDSLLRLSRKLIDLREIVKGDFSKAMGFGARLAEERRRLGLKQAEFASLAGTDVPKQSLYENERRELRAEYLARLPDMGVDVVYVLTGRRLEGEWLSGSASELLSAYLVLPPEMQEAVLSLSRAMRNQFEAEPQRTLHAKKPAYRSETSG
jgi:transcriptional regulator with XRE-family HTH domain